MTIKDSDIFAVASGGGGGGSMAKKYVYGMTITHLEDVRSVYDGLDYTRTSTSPTALTVVVDPAMDAVNFTINDPANPVGSIRTFPADLIPEDTLKWVGGQGWLKTGSYVAVDQLTKPYPEKMKTHLMAGTNIPTAASGWPTASIAYDVTTDDNGKWMAICGTNSVYGRNVTGSLLKSADDGLTWSVIGIAPTVGSGYARICTSKTGRWFYHSGYGNDFKYSDDFGVSWTTMTPPISSIPAAALKFIGGKLYYMPRTNLTFGHSTTTSNPVYYVCDNPLTTGALTWNTVNISTAVGITAGYPTGANGLLSWLDITPSGKVIILADGGATYNGVMFIYNPATTTWDMLPPAKVSKNGNGTVTWRQIIGAQLEGENLRLVSTTNSGNQNARLPIYEHLVLSNKDIHSYPYTAVPPDATGTEGNWTAIPPMNCGTGFIRDNGYSWTWAMNLQIFADGSYYTGQNRSYPVFNGAVASPVINGGNFITTIYCVGKSSNGTWLFFSTSGYNSVTRMRAAIGSVKLRLPEAGMADYLRVQ